MSTRKLVGTPVWVNRAVPRIYGFVAERFFGVGIDKRFGGPEQLPGLGWLSASAAASRCRPDWGEARFAVAEYAQEPLRGGDLGGIDGIAGAGNGPVVLHGDHARRGIEGGGVDYPRLAQEGFDMPVPGWKGWPSSAGRHIRGVVR